MSLFEYVSVMVSVILALGIAQILTAVGAHLTRRDRSRAYWLHSVWLVVLALYHIQVWWVLWDLRSRPPDTIAGFLFTLLIPAIAYLLTYVLVNGRFPMNAEDHFFRVKRPFFALLLGLLSCELLFPLVHGYSVPLLFRLASLLAITAAGVGFFTGDRRVQGAIGVYFLASRILLFAVRFQVGAFTPG